MSMQIKTERIVSFKVSEENYEKLEKYAFHSNSSIQECLVNILDEHLENLEIYYKLLDMDEETGKISFASND